MEPAVRRYVANANHCMKPAVKRYVTRTPRGMSSTLPLHGARRQAVCHQFDEEHPAALHLMPRPTSSGFHPRFQRDAIPIRLFLLNRQ